jgi:hypothetical protein
MLPNGRKNELFAGHDQGAENWASIASLIEPALSRARHRVDWTKPLRGNSVRQVLSGTTISRIS